jgi:phospho-N-acetylmuramoyl-pentapeptide-transferase
MGGAIIIISLIFSTLLWGRLNNWFVLGAIVLVFLMGLIGFFDDLVKLSKSDRPGLTAGQKSIWQLGVGVIFGIFIYWMFSKDGAGRGMTENGDLLRIQLPFFRDIIADPDNPVIRNINYIGFFYIPFTILVLFSTSNAVNLTDGLDGLAIGTSTITAIALMIITYLTSHQFAAGYLKIYHIKEAGELTVFVGALVGSCLGFLWFNGKPALVFMGDTGSLAIGASIGYVALVIHQELLLFLIGGIFVLEALSVVIQVSCYKMTKKRVFKCAPLHHHFEFIGWPESRIVNRFLIIAALMAILGIISLKLR